MERIIYLHDKTSQEEIIINRLKNKDGKYNLRLSLTNVTDYERVILMISEMFKKCQQQSP